MATLKQTDELSMDVDRGPNWLFVKLRADEPHSVKPIAGQATSIAPAQIDSPHFADELLSISAKHLTYRVVLELDQLSAMPNGMTSQMEILQARLAKQGGALRVCGLSPECEAEMRKSNLDKLLPNHTSREDALLGDSVLHEG